MLVPAVAFVGLRCSVVSCVDKLNVPNDEKGQIGGEIFLRLFNEKSGSNFGFLVEIIHEKFTLILRTLTCRIYIPVPSYFHLLLLK